MSKRKNERERYTTGFGMASTGELDRFCIPVHALTCTPIDLHFCGGQYVSWPHCSVSTETCRSGRQKEQRDSEWESASEHAKQLSRNYGSLIHMLLREVTATTVKVNIPRLCPCKHRDARAHQVGMTLGLFRCVGVIHQPVLYPDTLASQTTNRLR